MATVQDAFREILPNGAAVATRVRGNGGGNRGRRNNNKAATANNQQTSTEQIAHLFSTCTEQLSSKLLQAINDRDDTTLKILASYYTQTEPAVPTNLFEKKKVAGKRSAAAADADEDETELPFCVALARSTFMYHMLLDNATLDTGSMYAQLVAQVILQIPEPDRSIHPFMVVVVHQFLFGIPLPAGSTVFHLDDLQPHCVVQLPSRNYKVFRACCLMLFRKNADDEDELNGQMQLTINAWTKCLSDFVHEAQGNNIVGIRSQVMLLKQHVDVANDRLRQTCVEELHEVLRANHKEFSVDYLEMCYCKLQIVTPSYVMSDPENGSGRALAIHCSNLFLPFNSPFRREYVENFLYPALASEDMTRFILNPGLRRHMLTTLLSQCTPNITTSSPYYQCIVAILMQSIGNNLTDGAMQMHELMCCLMPHASWVLAALAIDPAWEDREGFARMFLLLSRGAAKVLHPNVTQDPNDAMIAEMMQVHGDATSVYNMIFCLREVIRRCATTSTTRAAQMKAKLRVCFPEQMLDTFITFVEQKFSPEHIQLAEDVIEPQVLLTEANMVLHLTNMNECVASVLSYFTSACQICPHCNRPKNTALICPKVPVAHVRNHVEISRIVTTLGECALEAQVGRRLSQELRSQPGNIAVHLTVYNILKRAGQNKQKLFNEIAGAIEFTLTQITATRRGGTQLVLNSTERANVWFFNTHILCFCQHMTGKDGGTTATRTLNLIKSLRFGRHETPYPSTHEALAAWYCANALLRAGNKVAELAITAGDENAPGTTQVQVNGRELLQVLHKVHCHSRSTKKLTGLCAYRLSEDFILQSPLIFEKLFGSFGTVEVQAVAGNAEQSVAEDVLAPWGISTSPNSPYWKFILDQLRQSPPARTAFATIVSQALATRFRGANQPASMITTTKKVEPHAPIVFVMTASVIQQSASHCEYLFSILQDMMETWTKTGGSLLGGRGQPVVDHLQQAGRFLSLSYCYQQLLLCFQQYAVAQRPRNEGDQALLPVSRRMNAGQLLPLSVAKRIVKKFRPHSLRQLKVLKKMVDEIQPSRDGKAFKKLVSRLGKMVSYVASDGKLNSFDDSTTDTGYDTASDFDASRAAAAASDFSSSQQHTTTNNTSSTTLETVFDTSSQNSSYRPMPQQHPQQQLHDEEDYSFEGAAAEEVGGAFDSSSYAGAGAGGSSGQSYEGDGDYEAPDFGDGPDDDDDDYQQSHGGDSSGGGSSYHDGSGFGGGGAASALRFKQENNDVFDTQHDDDAGAVMQKMMMPQQQQQQQQQQPLHLDSNPSAALAGLPHQQQHPNFSSTNRNPNTLAPTENFLGGSVAFQGHHIQYQRQYLGGGDLQTDSSSSTTAGGQQQYQTPVLGQGIPPSSSGAAALYTDSSVNSSVMGGLTGVTGVPNPVQNVLPPIHLGSTADPSSARFDPPPHASHQDMGTSPTHPQQTIETQTDFTSPLQEGDAAADFKSFMPSDAIRQKLATQNSTSALKEVDNIMKAHRREAQRARARQRSQQRSQFLNQGGTAGGNSGGIRPEVMEALMRQPRDTLRQEIRQLIGEELEEERRSQHNNSTTNQSQQQQEEDEGYTHQQQMFYHQQLLQQQQQQQQPMMMQSAPAPAATGGLGEEQWERDSSFTASSNSTAASRGRAATAAFLSASRDSSMIRSDSSSVVAANTAAGRHPAISRQGVGSALIEIAQMLQGDSPVDNNNSIQFHPPAPAAFTHHQQQQPRRTALAALATGVVGGGHQGTNLANLQPLQRGKRNRGLHEQQDAGEEGENDVPSLALPLGHKPEDLRDGFSHSLPNLQGQENFQQHKGADLQFGRNMQQQQQQNIRGGGFPPAAAIPLEASLQRGATEMRPAGSVSQSMQPIHPGGQQQFLQPGQQLIPVANQPAAVTNTPGSGNRRNTNTNINPQSFELV